MEIAMGMGKMMGMDRTMELVQGTGHGMIGG